jgi:hypothetical protein
MTGALLAILVGLAWLSSHLAAVRIYQVDECQNLYMARVLATGHASEFFTSGSLFLLGPLSWIAKKSSSSAEMFDISRLLFFGVFWLNLVLMALIAGNRLASTKGLLALVAAASLAPLWDYGMEIRHDNLILAGVLLTWWVVRVRAMGLLSYMIAGALAVSSLFIAVKSVVYVVPLSVMILAFPPPSHQRPRWYLLGAWAGGVLLATALIRLCYGSSGAWDLYLSVFHGVSKYSASGGGRAAGFGPGWALSRLLTQTPLLLAIATAAIFATASDLYRRRAEAISWESPLPEGLLLLGALCALIINPTPFPYNLLHIVPYAFLLGFRYADALWEELQSRAHLWPIVAGVLAFSHVVPFVVATKRHLNYQNFRQQILMQRAEELTDANRDRVYDGIGMVPTRDTIHFQWYLHSLNIQSFLAEGGTHVRDKLAAHPAAVFIPSYRTDWLPEADHAFIHDHYVALADDFWVLGKVFPAGSGTFKIIHQGRYRISSLSGSDIAGTYAQGLKGLTTPEESGSIAGTLDGQPISNSPVELGVGNHRIETASGTPAAVVWVGPRVDRLHRFSPGDHDALFVNWY